VPVPFGGLLCFSSGAASASADASLARVTGSLQAGVLTGLPLAGGRLVTRKKEKEFYSLSRIWLKGNCFDDG
jgi:hypothetical protein